MATKAGTTRARASAKKEKQSSAQGLIDALRFIKAAQVAQGLPYQTHCVIANNWVCATDGAITAGMKCEETLNVAPHTDTLLSALVKCGAEPLAISELDSGRLSVKAGKFKSLVPCEDIDSMPAIWPDPQCAVIDDTIKAGFKLLYDIALDSGPEPMKLAVMLQANTMVCTNGALIIEVWHGIDLPPWILIPKAAAFYISKVDKKLTGFGYSSASATFYFEDGSFYKTQLFQGNYPNYERLFTEANYWPLPNDFWTAVDTLSDMSEHALYFRTNRIQTDSNEAKGSSFDVDGMKGGFAMQHKFLKLARSVFEQVDFQETRAMFVSKKDNPINARGIIMYFGDAAN